MQVTESLEKGKKKPQGNQRDRSTFIDNFINKDLRGKQVKF